MILHCRPSFRVAEVRSRSVLGNSTPTSPNHEPGRDECFATGTDGNQVAGSLGAGTEIMGRPVVDHNNSMSTRVRRLRSRAAGRS